MLTFTVVASKGGVGKSTASANLGGLLRDLGYRVLRAGRRCSAIALPILPSRASDATRPVARRAAAARFVV